VQDIKGVFQYRNISDIARAKNGVASLAFFKQQVMVSAQRHRSVACAGVRVEAPTRFFPFFDCLSDVVVVSHQDAFPFFQF
jgi:hypothetical protein